MPILSPPQQQRKPPGRQRKRAKRPITQAEYQLLYTALDTAPQLHITKTRNCALLATQTNTSLRVSDLLLLTVADVEERPGRLRRSLSWRMAKTRDLVRIELVPDPLAPLSAWLTSYRAYLGGALPRDWPLWPVHPAYLTPGREPPWLSYKGWRATLEMATLAAGLDPAEIGTHSLRASLPGAYYAATGDVLGTQKLFGHTEPRTTAQYLYRVANDRATAARRDMAFSPPRMDKSPPPLDKSPDAGKLGAFLHPPAARPRPRAPALDLEQVHAFHGSGPRHTTPAPVQPPAPRRTKR